MNIRFARVAQSLAVVAAVLLMTGDCWAVFYPIGPSKDDWGMKYDVEITAVGNDKVNVSFALTDSGRLKPIHSITVVALRSVGGGSFAYDVKALIPLQTTADGTRSGQVQIPKKFADGALFRVLTFAVDGRRQTSGAALYDIPLKRFLNKAPAAAAATAPTNAVPSDATPTTQAAPPGIERR